MLRPWLFLDGGAGAYGLPGEKPEPTPAQQDTPPAEPKAEAPKPPAADEPKPETPVVAPDKPKAEEPKDKPKGQPDGGWQNLYQQKTEFLKTRAPELERDWQRFRKGEEPKPETTPGPEPAAPPPPPPPPPSFLDDLPDNVEDMTKDQLLKLIQHGGKTAATEAVQELEGRRKKEAEDNRMVEYNKAYKQETDTVKTEIDKLKNAKKEDGTAVIPPEIFDAAWNTVDSYNIAPVIGGPSAALQALINEIDRLMFRNNLQSVQTQISAQETTAARQTLLAGQPGSGPGGEPAELTETGKAIKDLEERAKRNAAGVMGGLPAEA